MDVSSVQRRRVKKTENGKHKNRNLSLKYYVLNDNQEKVFAMIANPYTKISMQFQFTYGYIA